MPMTRKQEIIKTVVEYVWLGGKNEFRSKTRVIDLNLNKKSLEYMEQNRYTNPLRSLPSIRFFPDWNYDGSSTNQATGTDSEIIIKPKALFRSPFGRPYDYIVLCDTYLPSGLVTQNNTRVEANNIFWGTRQKEKPWFGLEQEYFMMDLNTKAPLGFQSHKTQGQYYCSVGSENAFGRKIAEEHLSKCLDIGIKISGINAEVAPGQWEFQIGPCEGIKAGDHLLMARFILERVGEKHNIKIDFTAKPLKGDWNGSGCHTNYSTENMREGTEHKTGLEYINDAIYKLSKKHKEHMNVYGEGNRERMTGKHETADYDTFSDGVANRGASIRRGNETVKNKKGYFEDRRPSSDCDPYLVTSIIFKTTCLE